MTAIPFRSRGIALDGVAKSFGSVQAVHRIDLSIDPGETVALLGPNGAGKTTTIELVLGLLTPDHGKVSLLGLTPPEAIEAGEVGAMLQTGGLVRDLTVRELVTTMASLYPSPLDVDETLALTGTRDIAGRRTQKLSGGQAQRVRFALAIVSNPSVLVLDEPTVALDVEARHAFWTAMRAFAARGRTVVFATHYLEEADAYADRVVLMANGLVVANGPATEIKARVGLRTIRATLPDVSPSELARLPGVTNVERHGDAAILSCNDSDGALRSLLAAHPAVRDIEVHGARLDDAFLELTAAPGPLHALEVAQ